MGNLKVEKTARERGGGEYTSVRRRTPRNKSPLTLFVVVVRSHRRTLGISLVWNFHRTRVRVLKKVFETKEKIATGVFEPI